MAQGSEGASSAVYNLLKQDRERKAMREADEKRAREKEWPWWQTLLVVAAAALGFVLLMIILFGSNLFVYMSRLFT